jgi:hypothetical protein
MSIIPRPARQLWRNLLRLNYAIQAHPLTFLSGPEKRELLAFWARETGARIFVETGTYRGRTTLFMADRVARCITIEVDDALYRQAQAAFAGRAGIELHHGDSAALLPRILDTIAEPALFWLDGHYSGPGTGRAAAASPILQELRAILGHRVRGHCILIDDAREFLGRAGYPSIRRLQKLVKKEADDYRLRIANDIIHIQPELF